MSENHIHVPQEIKSHRFPELDSLRGLAAAAVVLHHYLLVYGMKHWYHLLMATPLRILFAGQEAVVLFFVLSGFVLSIPQSRPNHASYKGYLLKRFCRIYLPFMAAFCVALLFDAHYHRPAVTDNPWLNQTWSMRPNLKPVLKAMLTSNVHAQEYNTAFWSVLYEIRVSILFPMLYLVATRVPFRAMLLLTMISSVSIQMFPVYLPFEIMPTLLIATYFVYGILLFQNLTTVKDWWHRRTTREQNALLLCCLMLVMFGWKTAELESATLQHPRALAAGVSGSGMNYLSQMRTSAENAIMMSLAVIGAAGAIISSLFAIRFNRVLQRPALMRLGALSYSTYLIHGTVLFFLLRANNGRVPFVYLLPVYLLLTYLSSELFHWLVDQPSLRLGRKVGKLIH